MAVDAARAKSLFLAASDLADPAERAAYLERECGGDAELRQRVEALLAADDGGGRSVEGDATGTVGPRSAGDGEVRAVRSVFRCRQFRRQTCCRVDRRGRFLGLW